MFINESRTWTLPITQEYSGALMSPYKHFLASLSIDDYGCKVLWVLKDPWHHNHECLLALMSAVGAMAPCSWVFMAAYEYSWGLMNAQGCPRALISAHDWSLHHTLGTHKHSWVFMSTHEHSYVAMSTQEHGTIAPTALMRSNEHLWAWRHGATVLTKCGNVPRICCGNLLSCSILEAVASLGIRWLNVPVIASELFSKLKNS